VFSLRLGFSDESNFADDTSTKQAYDLLVEGFGPGFNRPLILAAELPEGTTPGDLAAITDAAAADPGVEFVSEPRPNDPDAPTAAMWELVPTSGPQDEATTDLVKRLRDEALPPAEDATGVDVAVTGNVAVNVDFSRYLSSRLPYFFTGSAGAVVPAADGGVPLAAGAAEGGHHEPAVHRRRLRDRGRTVPVGLAERPDQRRARADRAVGADDAVRHRLRLVDGLRGVPAVPGARGMAPHRRQPHLGRRRPGRHRQGHHRGGGDHGVRLRHVHPRERPHREAHGHRPGDGHPARRHHRPLLLVPATMELLGDRNWWLPRWLDRILPNIDVEGHAETVVEEPERERTPAGVG
jgi:hypothetical protein